MPRPPAVLAPLALLAACAVTSCGDSPQERLGRATLSDAFPAVDAFVSDLDAGRCDGALGRTTRAFQAAAPESAVRAVVAEMARVLGRAKAFRPERAESLVETGNPPSVREAVVVCAGTFERGGAVIRARVQRDAARGGWLIDGFEARGDLFTWTLRK